MQMKISSSFTVQTLTKLLVVLFAFHLTACSDGGGAMTAGAGDGSSGSSGSSGTAPSVGTIELTQFKQTFGDGYAVLGQSAQVQWISAAGTLESTLTTIDFKGTCGRGISKINVYVSKDAITPDSAKSEATAGTAATCSLGAWTWTKASIESVFTGVTTNDGMYRFRFVPVNGFDVELTDGQKTANVTLDTTAPAVPTTFTVNGTSGIAAGGSTTVVTGGGVITVVSSIATDVKKVVCTTVTGSFDLTDYTSAGSYTHTSTISPGSSTFTYKTYDNLGNTSSSASVTVGYVPPISGGASNFKFTGAYIAPAGLSSVSSSSMVRATMDQHSAEPPASSTETLAVGSSAYLKELE